MVTNLPATLTVLGIVPPVLPRGLLLDSAADVRAG